MSGQGGAVTVRALGFGILLGACLATANVYMGLKTGWWESGGVIGALLAFLVVRGGRRPDGTDDAAVTGTVLSQTATSSAAAMPAAMGLLGAIPALGLLGHHTPWWMLLAWGATLGVLGLVMAMVFREPFLVTEALPFPSAIAVAETIKELRQGLSRGGARVPLLGAAGAAIVTWLRDGIPAWIPSTTWLPLQISGLAGSSLTLGITWSPMLLGMGILAGLRNGIGLFFGAVVSWGILAPALVRSGAVSGPGYDNLLVFLLWPGVAIMVSAGLTSLVLQWRGIARALASGRDVGRGSWRMRALVIAAALAVVVVGWRGFGIHPAVGAALVGASIVAALVCTRSVGETGLAPITQLGQLTQVGHGALASSTAALSVSAASIVAGSIVQTAQTMESFRIGQLLHVAPARQVRSAGIGIAIGTLAALPAYLLVTHAYRLGSAELPAPGASTWKAVADLVERGSAAIPPGAGTAAGVAFLCGIALEVLARTRAGRILPSPLVLGLAFLVSADISCAIALGSILGAVLPRWSAWSEAQVASLGAGAMAGESILGVILAALIVSGVLTR